MTVISKYNIKTLEEGGKVYKFKVAPHGFFKSEKMQISTSKTAYGYFGKE